MKLTGTVFPALESDFASDSESTLQDVLAHADGDHYAIQITSETRDRLMSIQREAGHVHALPTSLRVPIGHLKQLPLATRMVIRVEVEHTPEELEVIDRWGPSSR